MTIVERTSYTRCGAGERIHGEPTMRAIFGATAMLAVLAACGPSEPAAPAAPSAEVIAKNSADLVAYLDAEYEEELQMSPQEMTSQGRKERYGELDDRSEAAMDEN